ncbi:MAG: RagB/SusD family nutrient uptake outer membrane protein [Bacteroidetes bacterium]|nr:MAG: RagB/SusD family nutrient uptake outer membrane protein [Bacteroidota bacterium]
MTTHTAMNVFRLHSTAWATGILLLLVLGPLVLLQGCTDLDEEVFGAVTAENFYQTEDEIIAALAPLYAQLRGVLDDYHNLSQVSTDETIVPTRGSDWFDGGIWQNTHRHTWDANLGFLNGAWVTAYTGVARANGLLQTLETADVPNKDAIVAETRALRAFYYYLLMDLFGNIPLVGDEPGEYTVDQENLPPTEPRPKVFAFIESELLAARSNLPVQHPAEGYGRLTQGAVDALLANMYLNAQVFSGTVTESGPTPGDARWQDAIDAADRVLNSGVYSLSEDWASIFAPGNAENPEHIFVVAHLPQDGLGMNFIMRTLHYNQYVPSPWNGFSTLAETFGKFDEDDSRRGIFLVGQAYSFITGEPVNNRQDEPLIFTPEINDFTDATEGEGVRILKFPPDPSSVGPNHGNDYPFFRVAEMYLIKAEALNELNGPNQESIDLLNDLRARVFEPDEPLVLADYPTQQALRDRILDERLYELFYEAKRRQDLIRHVKFTQAWAFKAESQPYRILFPIPQTQLDANPMLQQNPGY